jgi:hypothetical protein
MGGGSREIQLCTYLKIYDFNFRGSTPGPPPPSTTQLCFWNQTKKNFCDLTVITSFVGTYPYLAFSKLVKVALLSLLTLVLLYLFILWLTSYLLHTHH